MILMPCQTNILDSDMVLMCFDAKGVQDNTSEWGFVWIDIAEIRGVGSGRSFENCWPYIKAQHFIQDRYKNHTGSKHSMNLFVAYQQLDQSTMRAFYVQPTILLRISHIQVLDVPLDARWYRKRSMTAEETRRVMRAAFINEFDSVLKSHLLTSNHAE